MVKRDEVSVDVVGIIGKSWVVRENPISRQHVCDGQQVMVDDRLVFQQVKPTHLHNTIITRAYESADLRQGESSPDPESGWLLKFSVDLLVQWHVCGKIFKTIGLVFPEISTKLWKNVLSRKCWTILEKFLDPGSEVDEYKNLMSSLLSPDTSVVNFLWKPA